jgi:DNA-binding NarL/FixJ family response regulator
VVEDNDDERSVFARPKPYILVMTRVQSCAIMRASLEKSEEDKRMTECIQVLIVDDQPRARKSLKALLSTWPVLQKVEEIANGQEAIQLVEERQPDVVLMDLCMPGMDGLQATHLIKARWPQVKVIVLTLYGEYEAEAMAAGADAFVAKGEPADRLLATLSAVTASRLPPSNNIQGGLGE